MTAAPAPSPQQIRDRLLQAIDPQSNWLRGMKQLGSTFCDGCFSLPPYVNVTFSCEPARGLVVMRGTRNTQAAACKGKLEHWPVALLSFQQEKSFSWKNRVETGTGEECLQPYCSGCVRSYRGDIPCFWEKQCFSLRARCVEKPPLPPSRTSSPC